MKVSRKAEKGFAILDTLILIALIWFGDSVDALYLLVISLVLMFLV